MKTCSTCKERKPTSEFYKWKRSPDGYAASCKVCRREFERNKYKFNDALRVNKNQNTQNHRAERRQYVWDYLKTHPCVDCGETDAMVLEFDHVRDTKVMGITKAVQRGWEYLLTELPKCDVRCANCHRKKTYIQLGWHIPQ